MTAIEEQIRLLCADALPFCVVPKQLEQLQKTLKADQKVTKDSYEKQIISEQLDELRDGLDSSAFWKKIGLDAKAKTDVIGKIEEIFDKRLTDNQASYFVANLEKELSGKKKYVTMKLRCNSQFIEKADKLVFATFLDKKTTLDYDFGEDVKRITKDKLYQNLIRKGQ